MLRKIKNKINNRLDRMTDDIKYTNAISVAASICNKETFGPIKNCNAGKEIVMCGGGPSLKQYKPIPGALHVALNRALLNENIQYDWFIADDWDGVYFFQDELEKYDCKKFFGNQIGGEYSRQIPESFRLKCNASRYYTDSYMVKDGYQSRFVSDIDKMAVGNMPNIALSAIQILLFTNPKRIYLAGCDASQGHYIQPANLSAKEIKKHEEDLKYAVAGNKVIDKWKDFKAFAAAFYPDTEIVSINPVGLKGIFRDEFQQ